jgi:hypothetical protein
MMMMAMWMWRINMLRFWKGHHFKYLIIGHPLQAGNNYWVKMTTVLSVYNAAIKKRVIWHVNTA